MPIVKAGKGNALEKQCQNSPFMPELHGLAHIYEKRSVSEHNYSAQI